jgi:hypothetical protein
MNIWSLPVIIGLTVTSQLVPMAAEAPTRVSESNLFNSIGEQGFSYRWVSDSLAKAEHLECNSYSWCSFADIVGPSCPNELFVGLDFYDKNNELISSGGDVLPSSGRRRHIHVELGTNRLVDVNNLRVSFISCYKGLPTGKPDL